MISTIMTVLKTHRLDPVREKQTQIQIESIFKEAGICFSREHRLNDSNIPDFFIDGIAIEVKIKGNVKQIYRQCARYCSFDEVKSLILVTGKSMGLPALINNKPCYLFNISQQWL